MKLILNNIVILCTSLEFNVLWTLMFFYLNLKYAIKVNLSFLILLWCHSRHSFKELAEEGGIRKMQFIRNLVYKQVTVFQ